MILQKFIPVLLFTLSIGTLVACGPDSGSQNPTPPATNSPKQLEQPLTEEQATDRIKDLTQKIEKETGLKMNEWDIERAATRSPQESITTLTNFYELAKELKPDFSDYDSLIFRHQHSRAAITVDPQYPKELGISEDRTREAMEYSMLFLPNNRKNLSKTNSGLQMGLEALTGQKVILDYEFADNVSIYWGLKTLIKFVNQSEANLNLLKSLGEIHLSNISDPRNGRYYLPVNKINKAILMNALSEAPNELHRLREINRRASELGQKLGITVKHEPALTTNEYAEKILDILENEAQDPNTPLKKLEGISIAAGSGNILHEILFVSGFDEEGPETLNARLIEMKKQN